MSIAKKIDIFGDSILKGIQINPKDMKYHVDNHINIDMISEKYLLKIENYSKFGCTITKGYSLLQKYLGKGNVCDAIVMDFGGNDCDYNWREIAERPEDEHSPNTPIDVFIKTYHQIIETLKENGIIPILTNLPPLEPQRFFDWFCGRLNKENVMNWLGDIGAIYRHQEKYSRAVEEISREANVPLVDLRGAFLNYSRKIGHLLCEDGTHPNIEGQKIITAAFLDFAEKMSKTMYFQKFSFAQKYVRNI